VQETLFFLRISGKEQRKKKKKSTNSQQSASSHKKNKAGRRGENRKEKAQKGSGPSSLPKSFSIVARNRRIEKKGGTAAVKSESILRKDKHEERLPSKKKKSLNEQ